MRPIIGVLAEIDNELSTKVLNTYIHAIEMSGGIPILFPYVVECKTIEHFIDICDGFLFTGGADIDPKRYGEEASENIGAIQIHRDEFEFQVFEKVINTSKPILAICRGSQLVNVALGGTLYQDIPSEKPSEVLHKQEDFGSTPAHSVKLIADTPLLALVKQESIQVSSLHHQAIKTLGEGLEIMAVADDGIVEAIYLPRYQYLWAFQWHPERMFDTDMPSRLIFADFINACKPKGF